MLPPICDTNHHAVQIGLDFDKFNKGKGVWRHPDHLLKDADYVQQMNRTIDETLARHVINDQGEIKYTNNQSVEYYEFMSQSPETKSREVYAIDEKLLLKNCNE